ncbi:MAG: glycerophosphodiester phosphodiesterase family protein [Planctomycetota bacterium]
MKAHNLLNIAHRGQSGIYPENTVLAFRKAVALGVDMIEFDVWPTKDEHPVVMHDEKVDRTTNGKGAIADLTLDEIRALDAGSGERVPTLAEAVAAIPNTILLNIHVKRMKRELGRYVQRFKNALVEADCIGRAWLAMDDLDAIEWLRDWRPDLNFILLDGKFAQGYVQAALDLRIKMLQPGRATMSKEFMDTVHANGMTANVFYADTHEDMRRFIGMGVDGILTNYPERLKELLSAA